MKTGFPFNCGPADHPRGTAHSSRTEIKKNETFDTLFGGKLKFIQDRRGYRFSLDAVLLAAFVNARGVELVADLGTGNGVIPIILAHKNPRVKITGFELQPALVERARRGVDENGFAERIQILHCDIRRIRSLSRPETFDSVVCNPPYRRASSGRVSPNPEKQLARHEFAGDLKDFLSAGSFLLRLKGSFAIVYLAQRTAELLASLRDLRLEPKRVRTVHSRLGSNASLVLVEAVKGGRAGVEIAPALIVYDDEKNYTPEVAAMIEGSAA
jgi:tRNA1Val (adenine37-N6)-methyltransferase